MHGQTCILWANLILFSLEAALAERLARNGHGFYHRPPQYAKLASPTGRAHGASGFQLPAYAALASGKTLVCVTIIMPLEVLHPNARPKGRGLTLATRLACAVVLIAAAVGVAGWRRDRVGATARRQVAGLLSARPARR